MVAKRLDSRYEAGLRSGAWQKMRVNRGQEFVIGGYTVGSGNSCSKNSAGSKSRIVLVAQIDFLEWTGENQREVRRE